MPPDPELVRSTAARQYDVVSHAQLVEMGATSSWICHQVEAGRWQRLFRGTYAVHTGPPSWRTRAFAALAYAGSGAALSHRSAGHVHGFVETPPRVIEIGVDHGRRVVPQPGLVVRRRRVLPPARGRLRCIDRPSTVLDLVADARTDDDVVGVVCAAVRARTWPAEIRAALADRQRLPNRRLLVDLLGEVEDGVESPLERRYRHDVERRHALPRATLQQRERLADGWIRADAVYRGLGVRTELDGALAHPFGRTDADTWRDNAVLLERGDLTLRYRWTHVVGRPCAVARQVDDALRSRGWPGHGLPCGPACVVGPDRGARRGVTS